MVECMLCSRTQAAWRTSWALGAVTNWPWSDEETRPRKSGGGPGAVEGRLVTYRGIYSGSVQNFKEISHLWVALCLCFKASPNAKPFVWKLVTCHAIFPPKGTGKDCVTSQRNVYIGLALTCHAIFLPQRTRKDCVTSQRNVCKGLALTQRRKSTWKWAIGEFVKFEFKSQCYSVGSVSFTQICPRTAPEVWYRRTRRTTLLLVQSKNTMKQFLVLKQHIYITGCKYCVK